MALAGTLLGAGLLAHYDAILVVPALAYVAWSHPFGGGRSREGPAGGARGSSPASFIGAWLAAAACLFVVAGLFYFPYLLDPQAARTGGYLGDRIGDALLKNNLDSFQRFNVFYTSFYYYALTGLLVLGFLGWALQGAPGVRRIPGARYGAPALAIGAGLGMAIWPHALRDSSVDLAVLPFALILLGAFLSSSLDPGPRAAIVWLAAPFLGYNFGVALPLTHIYTVVPAWTLLAGLAGAQISNLKHQMANDKYQMANDKYQISNDKSLLFVLCALLLAALLGGYLYVAYLRHDVEFWQDWPHGRPVVYWSPYDELPATGFFGFSHRTGWKGVGALYADGRLNGDYGSNEEPDVTSWYTRGAPRACDTQPDNYFIADDVIDPWPVDLGHIQAGYDSIGRLALPNGKGTTVYRAHPAPVELGPLDVEALARAFDHTAVPVAFARSARGSRPADVNLGGVVRLVGYDVDTQRASPGGRLAVTLYWQPMVPIADDYHVFVHLEGDGSGRGATGIWGQADGRPVCWTYPTFDWRPGQIIADHHAVVIRPDTPPGDYPLLVGMYLPVSGRRLDLLDETGKPVSNDVVLTTVTIQE